MKLSLHPKNLIVSVLIVLAVQAGLVAYGATAWTLATAVALSALFVFMGAAINGTIWLVDEAVYVWNYILLTMAEHEQDEEGWVRIPPGDHPMGLWMAARILRKRRWIDIHPDSVDGTTLMARIREQRVVH